jgi:pyruvate dehydrogenase E1 component alpha subunit
LPRFRAHLVESGVCAEEDVAQMEESARTAVEDALQAALAASPPPPDELERDVYADYRNVPD